MALTQVTTGMLADASVTPAKLSQPLTAGTAVASTSGTSIDFTGIPSWVKRITVMFSGVSTNGTSIILLRGGAGSIDSTGYVGSGSYLVGSTATQTDTTGHLAVGSAVSATTTWSGMITLCLVSSNTWVFSSVMGRNDGVNYLAATTKTFSGTLDRVRITTSNGTDTFDAGSINILYE